MLVLGIVSCSKRDLSLSNEMKYFSLAVELSRTLTRILIWFDLRVRFGIEITEYAHKQISVLKYDVPLSDVVFHATTRYAEDWKTLMAGIQFVSQKV